MIWKRFQFMNFSIFLLFWSFYLIFKFCDPYLNVCVQYAHRYRTETITMHKKRTKTIFWRTIVSRRQNEGKKCRDEKKFELKILSIEFISSQYCLLPFSFFSFSFWKHAPSTTFLHSHPLTLHTLQILFSNSWNCFFFSHNFVVVIQLLCAIRYKMCQVNSTVYTKSMENENKNKNFYIFITLIDSLTIHKEIWNSTAKQQQQKLNRKFRPKRFVAGKTK